MVLPSSSKPTGQTTPGAGSERPAPSRPSSELMLSVTKPAYLNWLSSATLLATLTASHKVRSHRRRVRAIRETAV